MTRRSRCVAAAVVLSASVIVPASANAAAAGTALPIPNPLTANWTAPPGSYTMPATVPVDRAVTVDLSAATVTGSDGYLFTLRNGGRLTVVGGALRGPILGLVHDTVTAAGTGSVTITDTSLTDVRCIVCADGPGGPIDAELTGVRATGLGDGVRAVTNALDVDRTVLTGGGAPPLGSPAGLHSLDDAAGNVAVAASRLTVSDSTITGFTSAKFQGDSIIGETRVASADIENNTLGHNSDSGGIDSKIRSVTFTGNTVYSDGYRAVASHYGTLTASGNTIYQVARSARGQLGQAYQATGTLHATGDTVVLGAGAMLAFATYATTGKSAPGSTFPRVGAIRLSGITDRTGARLTGPTRIKAGSGYHPTIVIN